MQQYDTNKEFVKIFMEYKTNISQFAKMLGIPRSTVADWLHCKKYMKKYILDLIKFRLEN